MTGVQIWYWADHREISKLCRFAHGEIIPSDQLWSVAKELNDVGLNIMINKEKSVIFVDTKLFSQR